MSNVVIIGLELFGLFLMTYIPQNRSNSACPLSAVTEVVLFCSLPPVSSAKLMELKLTVDGLEKERDFYFSKLRDIELICQEHENEKSSVLTRIINILYATEVCLAIPKPSAY